MGHGRTEWTKAGGDNTRTDAREGKSKFYSYWLEAKLLTVAA